MSQDPVPSNNEEAMHHADDHPGDVEETKQEHAHATDGAVPEGQVEADRVHQERAPRQRVADDR